MSQNNEVELVRWEEFIPKIVVRVLLVEPDYSTRQILTALLRKCNYKVASVADGLQAWEILKRRHDSIDLILTELDLPSISGYALLTLITEHESCKNIPVIVTSMQDSVSMVLKCMLKGAADFLIKPLRKNELKNMWRHVWRRLSINNGQDLHNLATDQQHNVSSGDNVSTSVKRSKCSEKDANAQEDNVSPSLLATKSVRSESDRQYDDALREVDNGSSTGLDTELGSVSKHGLGISEESGLCRGAMDLISSMNNPLGNVVQTGSNWECSSLNSLAELNLSLGRPHDSVTKQVDEEHITNPSNVSAFSWYNSSKNTQSSCPLSISELTDVQGVTNSSPQRKTDDKLKGIVFDEGFSAGYAPMFQPIFSSAGHGSDLAEKSPNSTFHRDNSPFMTSLSLHSDPGTYSSTIDNSSSQAGEEVRNRDSVERHEYTNTTLCDEFVDQKNSECGSVSDLTDSNTNRVDMAGTSAIVKVVKVESCINTFELDTVKEKTNHHTAEREAALARFRLKRKERCFDKKVRYQSRKKRADERPRVKGQFVRQGPAGK